MLGLSLIKEWGGGSPDTEESFFVLEARMESLLAQGKFEAAYVDYLDNGADILDLIEIEEDTLEP